MEFNPEKNKVLSIGNYKINLDYTRQGIPIENVTFMKDIGVTVQTNLKFTRHFTDIVKKAYYVIRSIFNTLKHHDTEFYVMLYTTYVCFILEYASQVWSPILKLNIDRDISLDVYYTGKT